MAQQQLAKEQASLGELFSDLAEQTGQLIRQEAALAKVELTEKATSAGKSLGVLAAGAFLGYAGLLVLVSMLVIILSYMIPLWLAALLVGAGLVLAAYSLITSALAELKKTSWAPGETIETIKEDAQWLKKQV